MAASLKQLAADLGVTHALVSRVLNNKMGTTRVSAKTREAILKRAKEVNYVPNSLAVALKKGRKGAVGLFVHAMGVEGSELSLQFLQSASHCITSHGLNLWLQFFKTANEFRAACNENLLRKVDGLIVAGVSHGDLAESLEKIQAQGLQVVSAFHSSQLNENIVNYHVNHQVQTYLATKHLISIGCVRIAHFTASHVRQRGYLQAHREARLEVDENLLIPADSFEFGSGKRAMRLLQGSGHSFDAVAAQSDALAAGALSYLDETGVPRSQWPKVTGIDNSPIASTYSPIPLTSATSEMDTCAQMAVDAVVKKIEGISVQSKLIEPSLVIRESTVPRPPSQSAPKTRKTTSA